MEEQPKCEQIQPISVLIEKYVKHAFPVPEADESRSDAPGSHMARLFQMELLLSVAAGIPVFGLVAGGVKLCWDLLVFVLSRYSPFPRPPSHCFQRPSSSHHRHQGLCERRNRRSG